MGAIGAFGQGMGDQDIAHAWASGRTWFKVPPSVKVVLTGSPGATATAKDLVLAMAAHLGANGLLGVAAEIVGPAIDRLDLAGRITLASMATEMGGIIALLQPNDEVMRVLQPRHGKNANRSPNPTPTPHTGTSSRSTSTVSVR